MELTKERKKALRKKAIEEVPNIPVGYIIGYILGLSFILIVCRILKVESWNGYYWVIGIISVLMLFCIYWVISSFLLIYKKLKKEEEERITKANYIDRVFSKGDLWVIPKYPKDEKLETFEDFLSTFCEIKYYAHFTEEKEKIKILIIINGDNSFELEEIEKADFLDFYQINKYKL